MKDYYAVDWHPLLTVLPYLVYAVVVVLLGNAAVFLRRARAGHRHHARSARPVLADWQREGWLDDDGSDPVLEAVWARFEEARENARRARHLNAVHQKVQSSLYPGVTPLREIFPS